jgi:hypothetical protein
LTFFSTRKSNESKRDAESKTFEFVFFSLCKNDFFSKKEDFDSSFVDEENENEKDSNESNRADVFLARDANFLTRWFERRNDSKLKFEFWISWTSFSWDASFF